MGIERESGGVTITLPSAVRGLAASITYVFGTWRRAGATIGAMLVAYVVVVLSSFPLYSIQMGSRLMVLTAIVTLSGNLVATAGATGLVLTVLYAGLAGVATTVGYALIRTDRRNALAPTGGILPALIGTCGSCGSGILGLLGFAGIVAAFPFEGNLLRLAGTVVLTYFLIKAGDPTVCDTG